MMVYRCGFFLALLLGLFCNVSCTRHVGKAPETDAVLMSKLAEEHVKIGPRYAGSDGAEKAALWIQQKCRKLSPAWNVTVQEFEEQTVTGNVKFRNILVHKGTLNQDFVLLAAHYDTKFFPPEIPFAGANDGASGVAALLGILHAVKDKDLPVNIVFAFFDGEEARYDYNEKDGLHGSRYLAETWKKNGTLKHCKAMILLDMIGDKNLNITLSRDTGRTMRHLLLQAADQMNLRKYVGDYPGNILDDHVPFQNNGIPSIDLIDFQYGPENSYWHTSEDTLDKISGESMKIAADLAINLIWKLAEGVL